VNDRGQTADDQKSEDGWQIIEVGRRNAEVGILEGGEGEKMRGKNCRGGGQRTDSYLLFVIGYLFDRNVSLSNTHLTN
jgi:hypothetical protein